MTTEFARQFQVHRGYQEEAKGSEEGGGGGDRGDDFVPTEDAGDDAAKAAEAKAAEEKAAAEKKAAEDKAAEDKKRAEEKAEREKDVSIPKSRFDEAVRKERAEAEKARAQAKELEEKLRAQESGADVKKIQEDLDALEDKLEAAMTEGTPEQRKALRKQIREKEDALVDARVNERSVIATAVAIEQIRYDAEVSVLEREYPFLNVDEDETFDAELATELMDLKGAYEQTGLGSTAALKKAAKTLKHRLDAKKGEGKAKEDEVAAADKKKAEEKEAAEKKVKEAEAAEAEAKRKAAAVAKGTEAKGSQPPAKTGEVGKTDAEADKGKKVKDMSEKEFDDLPESEKKRLRGD